MTKKEIKDLLMLMLEAYPYAKDKITDPKVTISLWELAFGEDDAESVYKAARLHINTSKFFPTPADIREKMHRAEIIYNDIPTAPDRLIDAPKTSYIEDLTAYDDILDLEPDAKHCEHCPRKAYCYNKTT